MNREKRINLVSQVLEQHPETRDNQKLLCIEVWKAQGCQTLDDIARFGSSPTGIDRDRRRESILAKFPRNEEKYEHFKSYRAEFADGRLF